jgi:NAD(P)-dependent dehydrogenase (short-subunit alcohol dehydrogenase family)
VALVTGARQGVGRAIAAALEGAGAEVVGTSRGGGDGLRALDVTDPSSIGALMDGLGRLDILVNNAGVSIRRRAEDYAVDEWDAVLDTNLRGAFLMARAAAERMPDGGRVVNVSSTYARAAVAERAPYAASKAGLEQLTRALALEWAPRGILVNAVAPGLIDTGFDPLPEATKRAHAASLPLKRLGMPEDLVGAFVFLASDDARYFCGQTLHPNGGEIMP